MSLSKITIYLNFILMMFTISVLATPMKEISFKGHSVDFEVKTNREFITIHGSSEEIQGQLKLFEKDDSILLENINIKIPVKSLKTGMGLRDDHMYDKIFKTSSGTMPDITFSSEKVICKDINVCNVQGLLTINEKSNSVIVQIAISKGEEGSYSAKGIMTVTLKDYNIKPPEQFGVVVQNDIKISIDLVGASNSQVATANSN